MSTPRHKRRRLIVDPEQQSRIVFGIAWLPAVSIGLAALAMAWLYRVVDEETAQAGVLVRSLLPAFLCGICFQFLAIAILLWNSLKVSHRVYGPIYRMTKTLEAVREGDLGVRARLRDGDHLTELAQHLNGFLDWLERHPPAGVQITSGDATEVAEIEDVEVVRS